MRKLATLSKDFIGLVQICGLSMALRWLVCVVWHILAVLRSGNLGKPDQAMGAGPFEVNLKQHQCGFRIMGPRCVSGIREMYLRDVYLQRGWLDIRPHETVLDLGANMGNFTNMALALEPTSRVIAVEPNSYANGLFTESVKLNRGHPGRTTLIRGVLGQAAEKIREIHIVRVQSPFTEDQWFAWAKTSRIDFIKCDIEGGEFALLHKESKLLGMARALACEVHAFAGNMTAFLVDVEAAGFTMGPIAYAADRGSLVFVAKRNDVEPAALLTDKSLVRNTALECLPESLQRYIAGLHSL